jgi:hypothetical protein
VGFLFSILLSGVPFHWPSSFFGIRLCETILVTKQDNPRWCPLWSHSPSISLGLPLCVILLPAKQGNTRWFPLCIHSLGLCVFLACQKTRWSLADAFFESILRWPCSHTFKLRFPFLDRVRKLLSCMWKKRYWSFVVLFLHNSMALWFHCTWYCSLWVDVVITHWHRSHALLDP